MTYYIFSNQRGHGFGPCSFCIAIILLLLNNFSFANEPVALKKAQHLDVTLAIEKALNNSPSLKEVQSRFGALSQVPSQKGSLADPVLHLNAMNLPVDTFDTDQEAMTQLQIGFSQAFPFPGKLKLRQQASEFEAQAALHDVDEAKLKLIYKVKEHWWNLFYLEQALDILEKNKALLRQFIETARKKYEVGKGLQQDVLLAQVELSKLFDEQIKLKALRQSQQIQLNILMGDLPNVALSLNKDVMTALLNIKAETVLYQQAEKFRPLLHSLDKSIESSKSKLDLAKKDFYPNFNAGVMYGDRRGNNPMAMGGDERADFMTFKLGVTVPIFAHSKQSKAVSQHNHALAGSRHKLHKAKLDVMANISSAVTEYTKAKQQSELFETGIIPQAKQTVDSMLAGYQVNEVDFLNLVRSQMTLLNYELRYWKAITEAKQALARLIATVGQDNVTGENHE